MIGDFWTGSKVCLSVVLEFFDIRGVVDGVVMSWCSKRAVVVAGNVDFPGGRRFLCLGNQAPFICLKCEVVTPATRRVVQMAPSVVMLSSVRATDVGSTCVVCRSGVVGVGRVGWVDRGAGGMLLEGYFYMKFQ